MPRLAGVTQLRSDACGVLSARLRARVALVTARPTNLCSRAARPTLRFRTYVMPTLIVYDLSDGHTPVKRRCLRAGFRDCTRTHAGVWKRLPNTTLWHPNDNIHAVFRLFRTIVHAVEAHQNMIIEIEKLYGLPKVPGLIDSDEECDGPQSYR
jgi:hypothetical protein